MINNIIKPQDISVNTAPLYAGSIDYYTLLLSKGNVHFDINMQLGKMWGFNRCNIIGANGIQMLTIPMVKPAQGTHTPIKDVLISNHGNWEHLHWGALFSAYGKAPFFEYIEADLKHIYETHSHWLVDFNLAIHQLIVEYMNLPLLNVSSSGIIEPLPSEFLKNTQASANSAVPYYQVWSDRYGFVPGLSILDLMFNEGRQGLITMLKLIGTK